MGPFWGATVKVLTEMEGRVVKWDFVLYMVQLGLANIPVKEWIIHPDVDGLLYGHSDVWHYDVVSNYGEFFHSDVITRVVAMVIDAVVDGGVVDGGMVVVFVSALVDTLYVVAVSLESVWDTCTYVKPF